MGKSKKIKLFVGLFYISAVSLFLYFIFSKFSLQEITSYEFIKNNRDYFFELRQSNLILANSYLFYLQLFGFLLQGLDLQLQYFCWFYFWQMVRIDVCYFWNDNRCNCSLYFCKFFSKRND